MTIRSSRLLALAAALAASPGASAMGFAPAAYLPPRTPTQADHQRFAAAQDRRDRRAARNLRRLEARR